MLSVANISKNEANDPSNESILPVMFVVTHARQGDHHGTVEWQNCCTEPPALPTAVLREAMQLPSQVEGGEAQA